MKIFTIRHNADIYPLITLPLGLQHKFQRDGDIHRLIVMNPNKKDLKHHALALCTPLRAPSRRF